MVIDDKSWYVRVDISHRSTFKSGIAASKLADNRTWREERSEDISETWVAPRLGYQAASHSQATLNGRVRKEGTVRLSQRGVHHLGKVGVHPLLSLIHI